MIIQKTKSHLIIHAFLIASSYKVSNGYVCTYNLITWNVRCGGSGDGSGGTVHSK